jgi:hypothetical protein
MKYMLLCYHEEKFWERAGEVALAAGRNEAAQLVHDLHAKGQWLRSAPLHPSATATSVRVRDGRRVVTDGPFAETREVLGGFHLIDVPSLEDAIEAAARHARISHGTVEVRPVEEITGIPATK